MDFQKWIDEQRARSVEEANAEVDKAYRKVDEICQQLREKETALEEAEKKVSQLELRENRMKDNHRKRIEELQNELAEERTRTKVQTVSSSQIVESSDFQDRVAALQKDSAELAKLQEKHETLQKDTAKYHEVRIALVTKYGIRIDEAGPTIVDLRHKHNELKKKNDTLQDKLAKMEGIGTERDALQNSIAKYRKWDDALYEVSDVRIEAAAAAFANLRKERDENGKYAEELRSRVGSLQGVETALRTQISNAEERKKTAIKRAREALEAKLEAAEDKLKAAEYKVTLKQQKIRTLETRLMEASKFLTGETSLSNSSAAASPSSSKPSSAKASCGKSLSANPSSAARQSLPKASLGRPPAARPSLANASPAKSTSARPSPTSLMGSNRKHGRDGGEKEDPNAKHRKMLQASPQQPLERRYERPT